MYDLEAAAFLRDLASKLVDPSAGSPDDPLLLPNRKDRKALCRSLELLGQKYYKQDGRFSRLYLLALVFSGGRKELANHRFGIEQRIQWGKELLDMVDTLEGLPERFMTLRHPDHPLEIVLEDRESGRRVRLKSGTEVRTVLPVLAQLFGVR